MSNSLQPHSLQHTRLPCSSQYLQDLLKFMSVELVMLSHRLFRCDLCPCKKNAKGKAGIGVILLQAREQLSAQLSEQLSAVRGGW